MAAQDHVWFDRGEAGDRRAVIRLLREHVADGNKEPMLVFPEGTCTHAEYCIMFKKGSFELGAEVHPIAMRYRRRFGDPFWNSQNTSFPRHLFDLMTSWAVVCDVYYIDPVRIREDETSVQFANRVKRLICERASLVSVNWDGFLKRHRISPKFLDSRQRAFASIITRRLQGELPRPMSSSALAAIASGGLAQTSEHTLTSGMDSLGFFDKRTNKQELRAPRRRRSSRLYRNVLTLRRRRGEDADEADGGTTGLAGRRQRTVRFVESTLQNTVRWAMGIGLFVAAVLVTDRFMPASWKEAVRNGLIQ